MTHRQKSILSAQMSRTKKNQTAKIEVLTAVLMKILVLWHMIPCILAKIYRRLEGSCYFYLAVLYCSFNITCNYTVQTKPCSVHISFSCRDPESTRRHIPENMNVQSSKGFETIS